MTKLARMHTAEHLLTAVMRKFYGADRNLEFHLAEKKTKCDYTVPQPLTNQDLANIETLVNDEIERNHIVTSFMISRRDAGKYDLWRVPADVEELRIFKIGDFDEQPCRGPHVSSTAEVGRFEIGSYELRENGRTRIRFKVFEST
jgi:alanyl-tRNA synthetase